MVLRGVAIVLLGGYYGVSRWLQWCCYGVAMVFSMVLLGGCNGDARCCYGVARCCYGVTRWLLLCC